MTYHFSSLKPIIDLLSASWELSVDAISKKLGKSRTIIHKYLLALIEEWKVIKRWNPPYTTYFLKGFWWEKNIRENSVDPSFWSLSYSEQKILKEIFLKFSPTGKQYEWASWLIQWCHERWFDPNIKAKNYIDIHKYLLGLENDCGLHDASKAFWKDFNHIWIDELYYADQYKWMDFGRGKLAEIAFYAKQSQNKRLIQETLECVLPKIFCFVQKEWFDAIAMTPWSIERKNQLLKEFKNALLPCSLPFVEVIKYYENDIHIPQKSLKTRSERIENARNTIFVHDSDIKNYKKVLLIDDFVGSGATMNETAKKLKDDWVEKVIWFALVGNMNLSYDVINEL